jgi:hypothetical protein
MDPAIVLLGVFGIFIPALSPLPGPDFVGVDFVATGGRILSDGRNPVI